MRLSSRFDPRAVAEAADGYHARKMYLVHSMGAKGELKEPELAGATNAAMAAKLAGVSRIAHRYNP
jgi:hypothetical protein